MTAETRRWARYPRPGSLARAIADAHHAVHCGPDHASTCGTRFYACQGTIDPAVLMAIANAVRAHQRNEGNQR